MELKDIPVTSLSAVKARDREGWLALFADDAVVEDPVGPCEWDPEGKGQRGKAAIAAFYDMFAGFQDSFDFEIHHQEPRGCEVAVFVTMHITMKDGTKSSSKAINIYKQAPDGRVQSLRSFWNA
ncbi:hypothetical protein MB02_12475 [Croceicoccus estronivorus]|uniref:nuclear transport factor 2 family protein n=1 Tax=Croceicoccus estronivorus TaxID=1172626 RepID=UPI000834F382|nr:nuclear transport factor 2 family protein [Croceicoccus estronivorus]OCC23424.1 hypothetical protein MB02_12475 [Croceicoccus estronivorus]